MAHKWNADRPGKVPEDDALNRIAFAQRVAKEIGAWRQKDSLVVSLNGDWGAGKSTLKNLILYYLDEQSRAATKKAPIVVEFNPWQWSGQDKLLDGFFREIASAFRSDVIEDKQAAERLARFWEGLRLVSSAGVELADRLQETLTAIAALMAGGAGVASGYINDPTVKASFAYGSLFLMFVTGALGVYAPIAEKFGHIVEWHLKKKQPSLEAIKKNLRDELQKLEQPLLVVVDDIDRLTKREVRLLVQLIKANADFPNVVYLLLYQKGIVANALGEITCEKGEDFLKKIVQVELEVPAAPDHKMRSLFGTELERILQTAQIRWDKERWRRLFEDAVWPYFRTPRDIKRFLGVFEFYFEGHVTEGTLEVNPIDLILIETLRVFDAEAYEAVSRAFQRQRNVFIEIMFEDKEARKRFIIGIEQLVTRETIPEADRPRLKALLVGLFPQGRESFQRGEQDNWARDLRICDARHFPKYFQLGGEPGGVPAAVMARLLNAETNKEQLRHLLENAVNSGYFLALLERLRSVIDDVPEDQIERLIIALFDNSDSIPKSKDNSFVFASDGEREIARISALLLRRLPDSEVRMAVLHNAVMATQAITGPVLTVSLLSPRPDRESTEATNLIEAPSMVELQKALLPRIWQCATSGRIWSLKLAAGIIYRLREWAGADPVHKWIKDVLKNSTLAIQFLEHMLQQSQATGGGGTKTIFSLRPAQIEMFTSLEELVRAAESAAKSLLQKAAIRTAKSAISARAEGKARDEWFVQSFDSDGNPLPDKEA